MVEVRQGEYESFEFNIKRKMKKEKVVVCFPAYNAEKTLEKTINAIPQGFAYKALLVDDGSRDQTVKVSKGLGIKTIRHPQNRGYGGNQKTCYTLALDMGADVVVLLHPDFQYDPKTLPRLIEPIRRRKADFVWGSRFAEGGNPLAGGMPMYRYIGNRLITTIENLFLGSNFTELHSGLRAYNKKILEELPFHTYSDDFVFDQQFIIDAVLNDYKIAEVAIPTRYGKDSSSISIKRSIIYIYQGLLNLWKRKYLGRF